jgi:beta-lactamase superfamily II metal-dependent hydrolase
MRLKIHNVGHGGCISLKHQNGNSMVWDCGHTENHRPSYFLPYIEGIHRIDRFFVTNYDEDHISDLPNLIANLTLPLLHRNTSIDAPLLRSIKQQSGPISTAMESMLSMIGHYTGGPPEVPPEFPGVEFTTYWNSFSDFSDTNNCSLVTFLTCKGLKFIFPGDLERNGWLKLLERSSFRNDLLDTNIFIASHHGRESGYCAEVFELCFPSAVIFSDSNIKFASQEMSSKYATHCRGIPFNGNTRYVISTRNDRSFWWDL